MNLKIDVPNYHSMDTSPKQGKRKFFISSFRVFLIVNRYLVSYQRNFVIHFRRWNVLRHVQDEVDRWSHVRSLRQGKPIHVLSFLVHDSNNQHFCHAMLAANHAKFNHRIFTNSASATIAYILNYAVNSWFYSILDHF